MCCRGLHSAGKPLRYRGFPCPGLHRIAFPLVSELCQMMSGILALTLQRFLAPLLVSRHLSKCSIPSVDRFELHCGQPWAYGGVTRKAVKSYASITMFLSPSASESRKISSPRCSTTF
jgi:hypothetical protein